MTRRKWCTLFGGAVPALYLIPTALGHFPPQYTGDGTGDQIEDILYLYGRVQFGWNPGLTSDRLETLLDAELQAMKRDLLRFYEKERAEGFPHRFQKEGK